VTSTRDRALDAAVSLVGDGGMRALTHARVDAAAALPPGSASNWFRTRAALIAGVVTWIAEQERADFGAVEPPADAEAFIDLLTGMIEVQTTRHARRTRARFALFLDASPLAQTPLHDQRLGFERWMKSIAETLGMPDPAAAARTLLACGNGLVMHRLTVDPGAPVRPVVARAVRGCLTP
jgi:DNA-binding transcriptional regulator YbjK